MSGALTPDAPATRSLQQSGTTPSTLSPAPASPTVVDEGGGGVQYVALEGERLKRTVSIAGREFSTQLELRSSAEDVQVPLRALVGGLGSAEIEADPLGAWWKASLAGITPRLAPGFSDGMESRLPPVRCVDLFCGVGGFSAGVDQAAAELGRRVLCELAVDIDADALAVFRRNHRTRRAAVESVRSLVDYRLRGEGHKARFVYPPELLDSELAADCTQVDLVVAGPPCQGHSNLNNHTRRADRRNHLYLAAVAFAVAIEATAVVIENVTSVVHDNDCVVNSSRTLLEAHGYGVTDGVLAADEMGWPQTRKRHFLVARRLREQPTDGPIPLNDVRSALGDPRLRSVMWAIGGGQPLSKEARLHELPDLTDTNSERIRWLFDNEAHDLALAERPDCHRDGTTYGATYGRMHADQPAPTITTGYTTPGRGRFVHPTKPRTVSHAEAARLQGFPDTYCFEPSVGSPATSAQLSKWIGNAVTIPLGYAAALSALLPALGESDQEPSS